MKIRLELDDELVNKPLRLRERILVGLLLTLVSIVGGVKYNHQLDELSTLILGKD